MDQPARARLATCVLPALAALVFGSVAQAAPADRPRGVAAAFGNTIKALYADGKHQRIWLKEDGTWEAIGRRGKWSAGKWSHKDDKVCLKQAKPIPAPFKYCTHFPTDGGLGTVWASKDMTGQPIQLTLVKGIEKP